MTVILELEPEIEEKIKMQALKDGLKVEVYVQSIVKEATNKRERIEKLAEKSFAEILAPIQKGFEESGMSEDEIMQMFEEAREEVWQEKQNSK